MTSVNSSSRLTDAQINNQAFSTQTLIGFVFRHRASLLHDQITSVATQITNTTDNIKELSRLLADAKHHEASDESTDESTDEGKATEDFKNVLKGKYGVENFVYDSNDHWSANETIIQGLIDQQTNYSSQLSTTLQNLSNKYNNSFDLVKSFIEDINNDASDIISKI